MLRLKAVFELSYFEAALVQFALFTAYLLAIPSGFRIARVGYKRGVVVGLLAMGAGCLLFVPAAGLRVFELFLLALFVLAGGITVLQVSANPHVAALEARLGPPLTGCTAAEQRAYRSTVSQVPKRAFTTGLKIEPKVYDRPTLAK